MIRAEIKSPRQRSRRTAVIFSWSLVMMMFCVALNSVWHQGLKTGQIVNMVLMAVCFSAAFGGILPGGYVKSFRGAQATLFRRGKREVESTPEPVADLPASSHLDERETRLRDCAHYKAFTFTRWLTLVFFTTYATLLVFNAAWANRIVPAFFFLLLWTAWSLPQSIIMWTEPDMDESEPVATAKPAPNRRARLETILMYLFLAALLALVIYAGHKG